MIRKNNCATVILTAVCGLFAFVPTVDAAGWRVIGEDPKFPTDDVIVAFCSVTDPQYKLPADPAAKQIAHLRFNELSMTPAREGRYPTIFHVF